MIKGKPSSRKCWKATLHLAKIENTKKRRFSTYPSSLKGTSNSTCPCVSPSILSVKLLNAALSLCLNSLSA